jgi:hypothetical protein
MAPSPNLSLAGSSVSLDRPTLLGVGKIPSLSMIRTSESAAAATVRFPVARLTRRRRL